MQSDTSKRQRMHSVGSDGHVVLGLPEPLPWPGVPQSEKQFVEFSPFVVSHMPLPHTAAVPLPLPLLLPPLFPPSPQSDVQKPTSVAAHVPSPQTLFDVMSLP